MVLINFKNIGKQDVLVEQCLSWRPNVQGCLTGKIRNVCQTMSVLLAGALQEHFLFVTSKNVCQAHVSEVAKSTNIVLDKQNFSCLPNNACPFGLGFRIFRIHT